MACVANVPLPTLIVSFHQLGPQLILQKYLAELVTMTLFLALYAIHKWADPDKTKAVANCPSTAALNHIRTIPAPCTYNRKHISNFDYLAEPFINSFLVTAHSGEVLNKMKLSKRSNTR